MSRRTALALAGAVLVGTGLVSACSSDDEPEQPAAGSSESSSPTASPSADTSTGAAAKPKRPANGACYRLDYTEVVAPTNESRTVACAGKHTTMTIAVGDLDAVVDGHLLAVDSKRVRDQVASACPREFADFVGGTEDDRRLSMLRTVWFTPTVEQSDLGASWYRCDVLALAGDERLATLSGRMRGVLDREEGRRFGMCGTAEPGTPNFERVICSSGHSWRAVATVPFDQKAYPGVEAVRAAGDQPCQDAGADAAGGSLDYEWGYEWPTAKQWRDGQHYGICWVPDRG